MKGRTSFALAALLAVTSCGQDHYAQWKHLDAVYANQVPIAPGATYEDAMGGSYYGDDLSEKTSETSSYFFKLDPKDYDKTLAFYEKALAGCTRTTTEDGDVKYELTPKGAEAGESVYVVIGKDKLQIGEETKPGKHKES